MSTSNTPDLLGQAVGPIFEQLAAREQRILLAILERQAAVNYRAWGAEDTDSTVIGGFAKAAANEDMIAQILEDLDSDHGRLEADLHERFPHLENIFDSVLNGRPLDERLRLQMAAEAGASGLFKMLADAEPDLAARQKLMKCSHIEQSNADFLAQELGGP